MKRIIVLALAALLLAGCTVTEPTEPSVETTVPTTLETLPQGIYDPDSALEAQTSGAIRAYPLADACQGIWLLGDWVVLQHPDDRTWLDVYTGQDLVRSFSVLCDPALSADGTGTLVTDQGLGYYHEATGTLVVRDDRLQEKYVQVVPDSIQGLPMLSSDLTTAYYCTSEGIRTMDLETGISLNLRLRENTGTVLTGTCFDGELLVCVTAGKTGSVTEFVQTSNGQSVGTDTCLVSVDTFADRYFLIREPEGERVYQFGTRGEALQQFHPADPDAQVIPMLELGGVLTVAMSETATTLDFYSLDTGLRTASVTLEGLTGLDCFTADSRGCIWFLDGANLLCRWEPDRSALAEEVFYTHPWYTQEAPDTEGLAQCQAEADRISQEQGVEIRIWQSALEGIWQDRTPEYRVEVYEQYLPELEAVLNLFPEQILEDMGTLCASERLSISLVAEGDYESGSQEWLDGNAYLAVALGDSFREELIRTLYRVMDTYVLSQTSMIDTWNAGRPVEDRLELFLEALEPDNEEFFESSSVQKKLNTLCQAIRRAFGMRKYEAMLPWEQYLDYPLY